MSIFTPAHTVAEKIRDLIERAPAGGIFTPVKVSPVETHALVYGPVRFYVEAIGRTFEVSIQDVSPDRP